MDIRKEEGDLRKRAQASGTSGKREAELVEVACTLSGRWQTGDRQEVSGSGRDSPDTASNDGSFVTRSRIEQEESEVGVDAQVENLLQETRATMEELRNMMGGTDRHTKRKHHMSLRNTRPQLQLSLLQSSRGLKYKPWTFEDLNSVV